jgi:hypothetical protein
MRLIVLPCNDKLFFFFFFFQLQSLRRLLVYLILQNLSESAPRWKAPIWLCPLQPVSRRPLLRRDGQRHKHGEKARRKLTVCLSTTD